MFICFQYSFPTKTYDFLQKTFNLCNLHSLLYIPHGILHSLHSHPCNHHILCKPQPLSFLYILPCSLHSHHHSPHSLLCSLHNPLHIPHSPCKPQPPSSIPCVLDHILKELQHSQSKRLQGRLQHSHSDQALLHSQPPRERHLLQLQLQPHRRHGQQGSITTEFSSCCGS